MRDCIHPTFLAPCVSFFSRLFPNWPKVLGGSRLGCWALRIPVLSICPIRLWRDELFVTLRWLPRLCSMWSLNWLLFLSSLGPCCPTTVLYGSPHKTMERVRLDALGSVCHGIANSLFATRLGVLADTSVRRQISVLFWLTLAFLLCVNMMHLVLVISLFITFVLVVLLLHLLLLLHEKHFLNLLFSELLVNHFLFGREIIFLNLLPASLDLELLLVHLIVFFHALPILELSFLNLLVLDSPDHTQSLDSLGKDTYCIISNCCSCSSSKSSASSF